MLPVLLASHYPQALVSMCMLVCFLLWKREVWRQRCGMPMETLSRLTPEDWKTIWSVGSTCFLSSLTSLLLVKAQWGGYLKVRREIASAWGYQENFWNSLPSGRSCYWSLDLAIGPSTRISLEWTQGLDETFLKGRHLVIPSSRSCSLGAHSGCTAISEAFIESCVCLDWGSTDCRPCQSYVEKPWRTLTPLINPSVASF